LLFVPNSEQTRPRNRRPLLETPSQFWKRTAQVGQRQNPCN
jgi:hypothetical protein